MSTNVENKELPHLLKCFEASQGHLKAANGEIRELKGQIEIILTACCQVSLTDLKFMQDNGCDFYRTRPTGWLN